jgi:hypothetical protein
MLRGLKRLWVLPILVFFMALPCMGQQTDGSMTGKVADSTGAVVPGASVRVENKDTGLSFNTTTDEQGLFHIDHLPIGRYIVTAESSGFKKTASDVNVSLNQVVDVSIKLLPGEVTEVVTIEAGGDVLVETSTSTLAQGFESRKVVDLPAVNGNPIELAQLAPNVTTQAGGTAGEGGSVGGNRPRNNSFTLDGVDNNDSIVTGSVIQVIPEAVAEFTILTNQYSAEFGHSSAGQFNTVTKSGSNEFHGEVFYLNNNKNYNALDHLTKEAIADGSLPDVRPRFDFNRVGGAVGGPIIKNKLFFFGAYQYKTTGTAGSSASLNAPTAAGLAILSGLRGVSQFNLNLFKQFVPVPGGGNGNVATVELVNGNPVDIPLGTVNILIPSFNNRNTFNVNIDQVIGNNDQLRYRYNYDRARSPNPGTTNEIFTGSIQLLNQLASFTYIHSFSPKVLNEFRLAYRRQNQIFAIPDQFSDFPNIEIDELDINIGPEGNSPQGGISNNYQLVDNVSFVLGKHNFKTGVEFRLNIAPQSFLPRGRGEYDWSTLESFLMDIKPDGFNGALRGVGSSIFAANNKSVYAFFQDDFHITPNLTLNLGIRYEYTSIFRDEKLQALNAIASVPGVIEFREPKADKNDVAPRVGFAYSPSFNSGVGHKIFGDPGRSAIRGGFGISYDVLYGNLATLQLPVQFQTELDASAGSGGIFGTDTNFLQNGGVGSALLVPTTAAEARALTSSFITDHVDPYTISYTLSFAREIARDYSVEFRYLGTRGVKQITQVRLNAPRKVFERAGFSLPTFFNGVPDRKTLDTLPTLNQLQVFQEPFGLGVADFQQPTITTFLPIGSSSYHAGSVQLQRRFTRGFTITGNYTYSHTIDFGTNDLFTSRINPRRNQDVFDNGDMRGTSALDRTHRFVAYGIYEFPFFKDSSNKVARALLGGFQISAIYTAESGQPFTALSAADSNLNFDTAGDRALRNPNGIKGTGSAVNPVRNSRNQIVGYVPVNPNAEYIQAGAGVISTAGANTLRSEGINNWDIVLFKKFAVSENVKVEFRTEFFNAFNHEQLIVGNGSIVDPGGIGIANATNTSYANVASPNFNNPRLFSGRPRVINFGLKVIF